MPWSRTTGSPCPCASQWTAPLGDVWVPDEIAFMRCLLKWGAGLGRTTDVTRALAKPVTHLGWGHAKEPGARRAGTGRGVLQHGDPAARRGRPRPAGVGGRLAARARTARGVRPGGSGDARPGPGDRAGLPRRPDLRRGGRRPQPADRLGRGPAGRPPRRLTRPAAGHGRPGGRGCARRARTPGAGRPERPPRHPAQGVRRPRLPLGLLRSRAGVERHLVRHGRVRGPAQDARLPGARRRGGPRDHAKEPGPGRCPDRALRAAGVRPGQGTRAATAP
ncbi:hypothetical protein SCALM49S_10344 [Streptomyces californicus]